MVRVRYGGVGDAKSVFGELRPMREKLIRLRATVRPFGPDDLILSAVVKALDTAAYHFTHEPDFFALKPEQATTPHEGETPA